jgi:hypothetical protein
MNKPRYCCMIRRGAFIEWTTERLEGGCSLISIQTMAESHEKRFPPRDLVLPAPRMTKTARNTKGNRHARN